MTIEFNFAALRQHDIAGRLLLAYAKINARKFFERGSAESRFLLRVFVLLLTLPCSIVRARSTVPPIAPLQGYLPMAG